MHDVNLLFPFFGEQVIRKFLKEANIELDREGFLYVAVTPMLGQLDDTKNFDAAQEYCFLTQEQICQYESSLRGDTLLKALGIREPAHLFPDKISVAANRFCQDEKSAIMRRICRLIEAKVLTTPWNLSQSFVQSKSQKSMMLLDGIGDPSFGNGGYSFLKMPMKASSDQNDGLAKVKDQRAQINPVLKNPKSVTGTDADLRKLTKSKIKEKLKEIGYADEQLDSASRWDMIAMLKDVS